MKKIIKIFLSLVLFLNVSFVFAGEIDHFIVEFNKPKAETGEALDLTIKAVDKNDEIVKDYTGNILGLSQTDDTATLPDDLSSDDGYTFKLSDQGVKKFENAVIFNVTGEQTIDIYDTSDYDNLTGEGQITIIPGPTKEEKAEIEIVTPENNTTINNNLIRISGATKKNHQVQIEINDKTIVDTISNSDGIFEKEVELESGKNILKAYVLNSDSEIIGESEQYIINVDDNKPEFKKIILSPLSESGTVEEGTDIDVKVFATAKLKAVKLLFNDGVISLAETEDGVYTGSFKAPEGEEKNYPIDLVLADDFGHTTTKKEVASINVILVKKESAPIVETNTGTTETCSGITDKNLLKIDGIKLVKLKTKSILTWNKNQYADSYDIYQKNSQGKFDFIKNTKENKFEIEITGDKIKYNYFAVLAKAKGCSEDKTSEIELTGDLSDATKIQTGPKEILLMILFSLILGFILVIRRKKI